MKVITYILAFVLEVALTTAVLIILEKFNKKGQEWVQAITMVAAMFITFLIVGRLIYGL